MLTTVSKEIEWDMGHRVPYHDSKCRNPHGHRYKLKAEIVGHLVNVDRDPEEGMVIDFRHIKRILIEHVHDQLDHGFMYYENDEVMDPFAMLYTMTQHFKWIRVPFIPTAEEIVADLFKTLDEQFQLTYGDRAWLSKLILWETPTSTASVTTTRHTTE